MNDYFPESEKKPAPELGVVQKEGPNKGKVFVPDAGKNGSWLFPDEAREHGEMLDIKPIKRRPWIEVDGVRWDTKGD